MVPTRRRGRVVALLALVALGLTGTAVPAGAEARAFRAFAGCGVDLPEPDHNCYIGDAPSAYFKPFRKSVRYAICVRNPAGRVNCRKGRARKRRYNSAFVARKMVGRYQVTWFVKGKRVARWYYRLHPETEG